jgi:hypothetical protein
MDKKRYIKPEIDHVILDYSISLVMQSTIPPKPDPRAGDNKKSQPFSSPFGDKPFS